MRSLIFFALLALSIVLTNSAAVEDYNEGKFHIFWEGHKIFTGCPINMETRSTLIMSFCISATPKVKHLLKSLDSNLQGATLICIFFKKFDYFLGLAKNETKRKFFLAPSRPQPLFFKMSQDFVFSDSFEFEEKTKFHVHEPEKTISFVSFFADIKK